MAAERGDAPGGISCREFVELVTEYLEGSMPHALRARFDAHVSGCEGCAAHLDQMRQTLRLTGVLREESVPAMGRDDLLHAFRAWHTERTDTPPEGGE